MGDDGDDGDDGEMDARACAVCYETIEDAFDFPCCAAPESSTVQMCQLCALRICSHASDGIGRCPRCRGNIRKCERTGRVVVANASNVCRVCRQRRAVRDVCDACVVGARVALRYVCESCGGTQRIAHPMWRYCETPTSASAETWACHGRCGDYTRWRVHERDVCFVPIDDAPATWRTEGFEAARAEMLARRRQAFDGEGRGGWLARVGAACLVAFVGVGVALFGAEGSDARVEHRVRAGSFLSNISRNDVTQP
jgi:hypothetical protein